MTNQSPQNQQKKGILTALGAGKSVYIFDGEKILPATLGNSSLKACVGDRVLFTSIKDTQETAQLIIEKILPRKNCLQKSFGNSEKDIAANLDELLLVTAPDQLFNQNAIDRVLAVCDSEKIPVSIIRNKADLAEESRIEIYRGAGFDTKETSAKFGQGLDKLHELLSEPRLEIVALCGVSGVGKSTLLNALVPQANRITGEVSEKTGQGKQTTSQSFGVPYLRKTAPTLIIIDLPGSQQFGISHLTREQVRFAYPEFQVYAQNCNFNDCSHTAEPKCAVKKAVESGGLAVSRYETYLDMLAELERISPARKYNKTNK